MHKLFSILFIFSFLMLGSCSNSQKNQSSEKSKALTENQLIQIDRRLVEQEKTEIDRFIKQKHWKMKESPTGLRYMIYHHGNGEAATTGRIASIAYTVRLLNGPILYSSAKSGLKTFEIGYGGVVSGMEEGIILLKVGDKAKFILPSHLAFGLSGDGHKIPPNAPIIYNVTLVQLK